MDSIQKAVPSGTALQASWHQMRPLIFVILAMLFGTVMTVIAKLLETSNEDDSAMSPSQVSLCRIRMLNKIMGVDHFRAIPRHFDR